MIAVAGKARGGRILCDAGAKEGDVTRGGLASTRRRGARRALVGWTWVAHESVEPSPEATRAQGEIPPWPGVDGLCAEAEGYNNVHTQVRVEAGGSPGPGAVVALPLAPGDRDRAASGNIRREAHLRAQAAVVRRDERTSSSSLWNSWNVSRPWCRLRERISFSTTGSAPSPHPTLYPRHPSPLPA
jgi:hypothetical protein